MSADADLRPPARPGVDGRVRRRGWPRKNTPEQIAARQSLPRGHAGWEETNERSCDWPRPPAEMAGVVEALTAHMVLLVSVVGPLRFTLGAYHVDDIDGHLVEDGRRSEEVYVPLAHSEGGLAASMQRGIAAVLDGGSLQTFVLHDRMTRDSCFVFASTEEAVICARWLADHTAELRAWLHDPANPLYDERVAGVPRLSRHARLWQVDTHVLAPPSP